MKPIQISRYVYLINCITVFVTCQYLNDKSQLLSKISKQIISLGGCTFGIYLAHIYIKDHTAITRYISKLFQDIIPIPRMLYAFIYCIIIFICGYIITLLLKKIPFIKRIVSWFIMYLQKKYIYYKNVFNRVYGSIALYEGNWE